MKKDFLQSIICLAVLILVLAGLKIYDERTSAVTSLSHTLYKGLVR